VAPKIKLPKINFKKSGEKKGMSENLKKKLTSLLGGALVFFTIVGIISTVWGIVSLTGRLLDNSSKKEKYRDFLTPVVMLDPVYFDSSSKAGQSILIQSSLWSLIYTNGINYYSIDDVGNIVIPASDAEVAAATIYGVGTELIHQSVGDITNLTTYTEDTKSYHLPLSAGLNCYSPIIDDISKSGDTITLTVGYLAPTPDWGDDSQTFSVPDKFAYYVLKENSGQINLVAIKEMAAENQDALIAKYKEKLAK
jgi:hypothetical protein